MKLIFIIMYNLTKIQGQLISLENIRQFDPDQFQLLQKIGLKNERQKINQFVLPQRQPQNKLTQFKPIKPLHLALLQLFKKVNEFEVVHQQVKKIFNQFSIITISKYKSQDTYLIMFHMQKNCRTFCCKVPSFLMAQNSYNYKAFANDGKLHQRINNTFYHIFGSSYQISEIIYSKDLLIQNQQVHLEFYINSIEPIYRQRVMIKIQNARKYTVLVQVMVGQYLNHYKLNLNTLMRQQKIKLIRQCDFKDLIYIYLKNLFENQSLFLMKKIYQNQNYIETKIIDQANWLKNNRKIEGRINLYRGFICKKLNLAYQIFYQSNFFRFQTFDKKSCKIIYYNSSYNQIIELHPQIDYLMKNKKYNNVGVLLDKYLKNRILIQYTRDFQNKQ